VIRDASRSSGLVRGQCGARGSFRRYEHDSNVPRDIPVRSFLWSSSVSVFEIRFLVGNATHNSLREIKLCDLENEEEDTKSLRRWEKCIHLNGDYVEKMCLIYRVKSMKFIFHYSDTFVYTLFTGQPSYVHTRVYVDLRFTSYV